jgi:ubiquitin C-terminal hydrolase
LNEETETLEQRKGMATRRKTVTLYDCLDTFNSDELLKGDDKFYCGKCKEHHEALKKVDIYQTSKILIIQLKLFLTTGRSSSFSFMGGGSKKINDPVEFPIHGLDLSNYV